MPSLSSSAPERLRALQQGIRHLAQDGGYLSSLMVMQSLSILAEVVILDMKAGVLDPPMGTTQGKRPSGVRLLGR